MKLVPEFKVGETYNMTPAIKHILDFYVDFFSELINAQKGHQQNGDPFKSSENKQTVLRDIFNEPILVTS